ncbi:pleiotropic drug resistance 11 [Actinidia rufa]|uniref:Pleiotropic drug resistance 11 n=1 Tax=Actinidia rufa TaxID=165716 RepID=A0A7J0FH88_9ERIC|nr:pleiotropic drug resistance 11 [Actinidia rufa]
MASALAGDDLARSTSSRRSTAAMGSRRSMASGSLGEVWQAPPDVFTRSGRQSGSEDEEELRWAAIERLPTYDRLRKGVLSKILDNGLVVLDEVDVTRLGAQDKKHLMESILKVVEDDNDKFLRRLRDRTDRVGIEIPKIEVRYENLSIEGDVYVGGRALPTLFNSIMNTIETVLGLIRLVPSKKRKIQILKDVTGVVKPSRMTLLLGPPGAEPNPIFSYLRRTLINLQRTFSNRPPMKPTSVQATLIQAVARLRLLIWTFKVQFKLDRIRLASQTLDLHLLRVDLTPTSFPITRRTSYKRQCYTLDLRQVFPASRLTSDKLCCPSTDLRRRSCRSLDSQQVILSLAEPPIGFTITCQTFDGCRYFWSGSLFGLAVSGFAISCVGCHLLSSPVVASAISGSTVYHRSNTSPGPFPDLSHIQSQLDLLQSQLGSLLQQQPSGSTVTLAIGTPSLPGPDAATTSANLDGLFCPIPLFNSPPVQIPPASAAWAPLKVYTRRAPPLTPLPDSYSGFLILSLMGFCRANLVTPDTHLPLGIRDMDHSYILHNWLLLPAASRFFRQFIAFFGIHQMALSLFRFIAAVGRTQVVASTLGTFTLLMVFVLGGFIVAKNDIEPFMIWGYYLSPMMYGQNAIVMNEFLDKRWSTPNTDPRIDAPTVGQVLLKSRGFYTDDYMFWVCVVALLAFSLIFNILFIVALTYMNTLGDSKAVIVDEDAENKNKKSSGQITSEGIDTAVRNVSQGSDSIVRENAPRKGMVLPFQPLSLGFNHVNYYVDMPAVRNGLALYLSSWLRLSPDVDTKTRKMFVEEVMQLVELNPIRNSLVGLPGVDGLSTEQRKRLTIAVELVANPSIIFMDEPTSGLDARAAAIVMRTVRNTVNTGRTVLLLMKRGGQVIYAGPLGQQSHKLVEYFEAVPGVPKIRDGYNPATWMLEISAPPVEAQLEVDFADIYAKSSLYQRNQEMIKELSTPPPGSKDLHFPTKYCQPFRTQCKACFWKQRWSYWRNPRYNAIRFFMTIVIGVLFGCIFWNKGQQTAKQQDLMNLLGAMYSAVLFLGATNASSVQSIVAIERTVFYREKAAGMYSPLPYAFAQQIPIWWRWYYWASPVAWTLYGVVTSQVGNKSDMLEIPGAGNVPVKAFLKSYMGYDYDFLPAVAVAHVGFVVLFVFVFAYGIKFLNFQRR